MAKGRCYCGFVSYEVQGEAEHCVLCHCRDCCHHAAAAPVAWAAFKSTAFSVTSGETQIYNSSPDVERHFCPKCGTGLFHFNENELPGLVDIRALTFDEPGAFAPQIHIQTAERVGWNADTRGLPEFERFPPM